MDGSTYLKTRLVVSIFTLVFLVVGVRQAEARYVYAPFGDANTIDADFDGAESVYAADIDGDGDMDVLGAAYQAHDIAWWENTAGDGSAWTEHDVNDNFDAARSVYAADIDGDGEQVLGIPITEPKPGKLEQCWQPGPTTGSRFTEQELKNIVSKSPGSSLKYSVPMPIIEGNWRQIAGNPDLGELTSEKQQPVDFAIWQARDGTWQLWSCIRRTKCGGNTRLFYRWEGKNLTDSNWKPMGIAMQADTSLGEQEGGLQAPYVIKIDDVYYMFYGDWQRICLAKSDDGKNFTRVLNEKGQPDLFTGPYENTRDPRVLFAKDRYHCYYTDHFTKENIGAIFCRTSKDMRNWYGPVKVSAGGRAGSTKWSAECPYVVYMKDSGLYYLFRTQKYGKNNVSSIYVSADPRNFGVNDDSRFLGTLPVAAPEIIKHNNQYYIAALMPSLQGIRIARLKWVHPR